MKITIHHSIIIIVMLFLSLTSSVLASGEVVSSQSGNCQACSNGAPQIKEYISWMSSILGKLKEVSNQHPGANPGQGNNLDSQKKRSSQWQNQLSNTNLTLSPDGVSQGMKSDIQALDYLLKTIDATAITLINTKFQWTDDSIDSKIKDLIQTEINKQVGANKLFSNAGSLTVTNYQGLMDQLLDIHKKMITTLTAASGYQFTWQGYSSNSGFINKTISYYSCAQGPLSCNKSKGARQNIAQDIKYNWGTIVSSFQQIGEAFSKQYRDTSDMQRDGGIIKIGDGAKQTIKDAASAGNYVKAGAKVVGSATTSMWSTLGNVFDGDNRSQGGKARKAKRAARQQQKEQQRLTTQAIKDTQGAIKQGGPIEVNPSSPQAQENSSAGFILIQSVINEATESNLKHQLEHKKYSITINARAITHKIPALTEQMWSTMGSIQTSNNAAVSSCELHCGNQGGHGQCGTPIVS